MPARLDWNYSPNLVSNPIPNISSKEWKFESASGADGDPLLPGLPAPWEAERRGSVFSDNCECTCGEEGRDR